jgi:hypothetical protein
MVMANRPTDATETLAQYRGVLEADGRGLREVDEPRCFATGHASPLPFLPTLDKTDWHPARPLAPDRPRRSRADDGGQAPLFPRTSAIAT